MADKSVIFYRPYEDFEEKAAKKNLKAAALQPLKVMREGFASLETWEKEPLHQVVLDTAEQLDMKLGKVAQPLRVALTGSSASPAIDATLYLLGRDQSLQNIDRAIDYIELRIQQSET